MLRLRRAGQLTGHQVPEIILLNSHDGSSSYQMLPGLFRGVCTNGLVCGQSFGEVRVSHKGNVVEKVIEGAYEVLGVFDRVEEKRDAMQSLVLPAPPSCTGKCRTEVSIWRGPPASHGIAVADPASSGGLQRRPVDCLPACAGEPDERWIVRANRTGKSSRTVLLPVLMVM